jgi:hypothetical protein
MNATNYLWLLLLLLDDLSSHLISSEQGLISRRKALMKYLFKEDVADFRRVVLQCGLNREAISLQRFK